LSSRDIASAPPHAIALPPASTLLDDTTSDAVRALTAHLETAHATFTTGQAALVDNYETVSRLLANVRLTLANPELGSGPYDDLIDDTDRRLIALLAAGKTRPVMAAEAGITQYEMNQRLKHLYELTGSTMLFEFGVRCVSRLWLPADPGSPRRGR
jgi:hypothetical protein